MEEEHENEETGREKENRIMRKERGDSYSVNDHDGLMLMYIRAFVMRSI